MNKLKTLIKNWFNQRSNLQDSKRLNWLIKNMVDIEAPEYGESYTWVVYTKDNAFGAGAGCHRNLRTAIDIAMQKPQIGLKVVK